MIRIDNDGTRIIDTNYWTTENAQHGLLYLSINAGTIRLLVPESAEPLIRSAYAADRAAIQIADAVRRGVAAVHVVWEDGTQGPPFISIDVRQCDRLLPSTEEGRWVPLVAYLGRPDGVTETARTWPALIRRAALEPSSMRVPPTPPNFK